MAKKYCYKFKYNYIKIDEDNAYKKPLIEKYDFKPVQEGENGEYYWTGVWAKTVNIDKKSAVAKWVKRNIENIYKKEKEVTDSKWIKEILEAGYEFDDDGKLVENPHYLEGLTGQLCVDSEGELAGAIYLNMSGCVEFYDSDALIGACFADIMKLIKTDAIYKTVLRLKGDKKRKIKGKGKGKHRKMDTPRDNNVLVQDPDKISVGQVHVHVSEDALDNGKSKKSDKKTKSNKGQFMVKTLNGYYICDNTFTSLKEKAFVFDDFKVAKKALKNCECGGKVVKL